MVLRAVAHDARLRMIHDADQTRPREVAASCISGIVVAQGAEICFSAYRLIGHSGRVLGRVPAPAHVVWADALAGNPVGALRSSRVFRAS